VEQEQEVLALTPTFKNNFKLKLTPVEFEISKINSVSVDILY
jgi:hypothetical protein